MYNCVKLTPHMVVLTPISKPFDYKNSHLLDASLQEPLSQSDIKAAVHLPNLSYFEKAADKDSKAGLAILLWASKVMKNASLYPHPTRIKLCWVNYFMSRLFKSVSGSCQAARITDNFDIWKQERFTWSFFAKCFVWEQRKWLQCGRSRSRARCWNKVAYKAN